MFHKNYHKGETYHHTAARENDISMALNQMCGFRLNGQSASSSGIVRISCYNSTSGKLSSGSAVTFSESASLCGDSVPVEKCSDDQKPWAVLENSLEPNKIGSAIVAGCAIVNVSGSALDYIAPDTQNPGTFKFSDTGTARVLFSGDGKCIVLLGVGTNDSYDGPFAISYNAESGLLAITGGYVQQNGTITPVPAGSVSASAGLVCLVVSNQSGTLVFSYAVVSGAPISSATETRVLLGCAIAENGGFRICQYPQSMPVPVFLEEFSKVKAGGSGDTEKYLKDKIVLDESVSGVLDLVYISTAHPNDNTNLGYMKVRLKSGLSNGVLAVENGVLIIKETATCPYGQ